MPKVCGSIAINAALTPLAVQPSKRKSMMSLAEPQDITVGLAADPRLATDAEFHLPKKSTRRCDVASAFDATRDSLTRAMQKEKCEEPLDVYLPAEHGSDTESG